MTQSIIYAKMHHRRKNFDLQSRSYELARYSDATLHTSDHYAFAAITDCFPTLLFHLSNSSDKVADNLRLRWITRTMPYRSLPHAHAHIAHRKSHHFRHRQGRRMRLFSFRVEFNTTRSEMMRNDADLRILDINTCNGAVNCAGIGADNDAIKGVY